MGRGRIRKDLEILSEKVELKYLTLYLMRDSSQSSEDQNADRNVAGKDQAQEVSAAKEDCIDCWTLGIVYCGLAESLYFAPV